MIDVKCGIQGKLREVFLLIISKILGKLRYEIIALNISKTDNICISFFVSFFTIIFFYSNHFSIF
jgi:hypothetical protein